MRSEVQDKTDSLLCLSRWFELEQFNSWTCLFPSAEWWLKCSPLLVASSLRWCGVTEAEIPRLEPWWVLDTWAEYRPSSTRWGTLWGNTGSPWSAARAAKARGDVEGEFLKVDFNLQTWKITLFNNKKGWNYNVWCHFAATFSCSLPNFMMTK